MSQLTRREFLQSFVPGRNTRRIILAVLIVPLVIFAATLFVDAWRSGSLSSALTWVGLAAVCYLTLFLLRLIALEFLRKIAATSDAFRGFLTNLLVLGSVVICMLTGASLYARWSAGADISSCLIALGAFFLTTLLHHSKRAL